MHIQPYRSYIARNNKVYNVNRSKTPGIYCDDEGFDVWFEDGKCVYEQGKHYLDLIEEIGYIDAAIKEILDVVDNNLYKSLSTAQMEQMQILIKELLDAN